MEWIVAGLCLAVLVIAAAWVAWHKWIAPWRQVEQLVRQIARGESPSSFVVPASRDGQRVAIALEEIVFRQQALQTQLAQRLSGEKAIFSAIQDALLVVDGERRVAHLNATFAEWFGVRAESLGLPVMEVVRDTAMAQVLDATLRKQQPVQRELSVGDRELQMKAVPMGGDNGKVLGAVALFHDITEFKRLDTMRRDFIANVSHELRTPLSILHGYVETLLDAGHTSRDELRRILGVMERHSKRLGLLLNDLLTLAKLESTNPNLEFSVIRLDELCLNVTREWERRLAEKNLRVVVDLARGLPNVSADASRLEEVLYNLLDNAVKYSPAGGEIRLRTEQQDNSVALSVSDHGVGISREDLPRIFERFYRADKSRSNSAPGTGLGLAIVKHIAQLHGGRVEAHSELGKGTTIRVILPGNTGAVVSEESGRDAVRPRGVTQT